LTRCRLLIVISSAELVLAFEVYHQITPSRHRANRFALFLLPLSFIILKTHSHIILFYNCIALRSGTRMLRTIMHNYVFNHLSVQLGYSVPISIVTITFYFVRFACVKGKRRRRHAYICCACSCLLPIHCFARSSSNAHC